MLAKVTIVNVGTLVNDSGRIALVHVMNAYRGSGGTGSFIHS
jgi:hypothetical protein